jgi:hypothetical protein
MILKEKLKRIWTSGNTLFYSENLLDLLQLIGLKDFSFSHKAHINELYNKKVINRSGVSDSNRFPILHGENLSKSVPDCGLCA